MLALCQDAERGLLPVAGGVLDQAAAFNTVRRYVRAERAAVGSAQTPEPD